VITITPIAAHRCFVRADSETGLPMPRTAWLLDLGRDAPYERTWELQRRLVERRSRDEIPDVLVLCEHEPVLTVGRGTKEAPPPELPLPVFEIERGGEATYHGPGQLTGYPILKLEEGRRDLHRHLRDLEQVLIDAIGEHEIEGAGRNPPHTGVWVGERKVASIGIAVRRWVTYHGFALNVATDLEPFRRFRPCGLDGSVMTTMAELLGRPVDHAEVRSSVARRLAARFDLALVPAPPEAAET